MKIGLNSVDGTYNTNFGSSLQCFALYSFLEELFPKDEVVYLSYQSKKQKKDSIVTEKILYGKSLKSICDLELLDKCVIGSDCIMYFNKRDERNLNEIFMPNYQVDKILYSIGSQNEQHEMKPYWREYLSNMEYVSIRDIDNQKYILNSIVNIDPTLLYDENWWDKHIVKPSGLDENEIQKTNITYCPWFLKNDTGWFKKPDGCMECYLNEHIKSPFEFLWVLKNCMEVHSYSFHAFIFSLIFNKPLFIHNATYNFKLTNLMKLLNIRLENGKFINRNEIMSNIKNQRKISEIYLKYMIGKGRQ